MELEIREFSFKNSRSNAKKSFLTLLSSAGTNNTDSTLLEKQGT
jgi:hypothetical protein